MADNVLNNLVSNSIKDVLTETKPKSGSITGEIAQALSSFSAEKVKTKMDTINADFVEFGASSSDLTKVIGTHIGGGSSPDEAAVYGNLGNLLANNWAEISMTLEEFQNNFDKWSRAVSLIVATNSEFQADVSQIYETGFDTTSVKNTMAAYKAGEVTAASVIASTNFYKGHAEKDSTKSETDSKTEEKNYYFDGLSSSGGSSYEVNTSDSGRTADDMYKDACDLKNEIYTEMEYLNGYKSDLEFAKDALERAYNSPNNELSQEKYNELMSEYTARINACDTELEKRSSIYNNLNDITADNFGTDDGVLKDSRDWGNNDVTAAREALKSINEATTELTPVSAVSAEYNADGTFEKNAYALSALRIPSEYGNYSGNLEDVSVINGSGGSVSNLTMKSAYEVANSNSNVKELDSAPGVYLFNTSDYLYNDSTMWAPNGGTAGVPETTYLSYGNLDGFDSVYDSNTGKFYTYDEYNNMQNSK